jgi:hypothetical protein
MRYLKPKPMPILIKDKVYNILFTLDVIDRLQTDTQMPMTEILEWTLNEKTTEIAIKCLLKYLIGIDIEIDNLNYLSTMIITAFIEQAKCKEIQGHTPQASGKADFIDVERWVYIGKVVLKYPEDEVWEMTLGKIGTLHREHLKYTGAIKEEQEVSLLSI